MPGCQRSQATDIRIITRRASERIIRRAFDLAQSRGRGASRDGKRRVTYITEITGKEGVQVHTRDIYRFHQVTVDEQGRSIGNYTAEDYVPSFYDEFKLKGMSVSREMFLSETTKKKKASAVPPAAPPPAGR